MAAGKAKSRKRSSGNAQRPLKGFTLYICNSLDFDELAQTLDKARIRYHRHREYFGGWVEDKVLLPLVGRKRWILLTTDQRQRTKQIEQHQIRQYRIREFVLTEGDWGKSAICDAILKAKNKMRELCKHNPGPFIASISKNGEVRPRTFQVA